MNKAITNVLERLVEATGEIGVASTWRCHVTAYSGARSHHSVSFHTSGRSSPESTPISA